MNPTSLTPKAANANLLVVDDIPANLQLLATMLKRNGFKVRPVISGHLALEAARQEPPDLILLDINMPEMNGYEVCQHLKADPRLKPIPVIFLSALDDALDKVKAFGVGGVDYITKPFQFEEVEARVRTHLQLRRQEQKLEDSYTKLQDLERLRDSLVHMIVHDLRSPLCALRLSIDVLRMHPDEATLGKLCRSMETSTNGLIDMVNQLLAISRLEAGQMPLQKQEHDLALLVQSRLAAVAPLAGPRRLQVEAPATCRANFDEELISRTITNLLTNAFKFTPETGAVTVALTVRPRDLLFAVKDTGQGIAPEYHQKIFEKFAQAEIRQKRLGTGLGLAFCKLVVEAHGGTIGVESAAGQGSTFWFTLPQPESLPPA